MEGQGRTQTFPEGWSSEGGAWEKGHGVGTTFLPEIPGSGVGKGRRFRQDMPVKAHGVTGMDGVRPTVAETSLGWFPERPAARAKPIPYGRIRLHACATGSVPSDRVASWTVVERLWSRFQRDRGSGRSRLHLPTKDRPKGSPAAPGAGGEGRAAGADSPCGVSAMAVKAGRNMFRSMNPIPRARATAAPQGLSVEPRPVS